MTSAVLEADRLAISPGCPVHRTCCQQGWRGKPSASASLKTLPGAPPREI
jgi:hypothetical protein